MNPQEWDRWLRGLLERHPLKEPPEEMRRDYHRQVMDRILAPPVWVFKPGLVFRWGGALAAVAAVLVLLPTPARLARVADRESAVLIEAGEMAFLDSPELEQDLREHDRIVLAEAAPGDGEEALEIWDDLESLEEIPAGAEPDSGEELEKELRQLDASGLAFS